MLLPADLVALSFLRLTTREAGEKACPTTISMSLLYSSHFASSDGALSHRGCTLSVREVCAMSYMRCAVSFFFSSSMPRVRCA